MMKTIIAASLFSILYGCGTSNNQTIYTVPGLQATSWTMKPSEEETPVIWNGRIIIIMFQRPEGGTPYVQVVDYETKAVLSSVETTDFTMGSAIVENGTLYIYGTTELDTATAIANPGNSIELISTNDMQTWSSPQIIYTTSPGTIVWNTSVAKTNTGYVMAYDFSASTSETSPSQARFLASTDLYNWNQTGGVLYGENNYLAAITIRYNGDYYYAAYAQSYHDKSGYYLPTIVSRSTDLRTWETGTKYALVSPLDEPVDLSTATDADLVELNGKTIVFYSTGPQNGWTNQVLRARECYCSSKDLFLSAF